MNWNPLALFFEHVGEALEGTPAAGAVSADVQNVEDVAPAIAVAAANSALSSIPGGALFEGLADDVIPLIIGHLFQAASPAGQLAAHKVVATAATMAGTVYVPETARLASGARTPGVGEIVQPEPSPPMGAATTVVNQIGPSA